MNEKNNDDELTLVEPSKEEKINDDQKTPFRISRILHEDVHFDPNKN